MSDIAKQVFGLVLCLLTLLSSDNAVYPTVTLLSFLSNTGFSFRAGRAIDIDEKAPTDIDLFWDPKSGLCANNAKVAWLADFGGSGGIIALGKKAIGEIKNTPTESFDLFIKADDLNIGYCFCVKTGDGRAFGVIRITSHTAKELKFQWKLGDKKGKRAP